MQPTLLKLGILEFHGYTLMMAIAFLIGVLLAVRENYKLEKPYPITPMGGLWVYLGGLIGARLYWLLQYDAAWYKHLHHALFFWQNGLVFYGGLFGGFLGAVIYLRIQRVPIIPVGDIVMPFLPLSHAIARIGCFLNGCCWGSPTDMPWGIRYPKRPWGAYAQHVSEGLIPGDAAASLAVHPTQLYSAAGLLVIFAVMRYAYKHRSHSGAVMLLYPFLYGILRFIVECFRGDSGRPLWGMTASQGVALVLAVGTAFGYVMLRRTIWRPKEEAQTPVTDRAPQTKENLP